MKKNHRVCAGCDHSRIMWRETGELRYGRKRKLEWLCVMGGGIESDPVPESCPRFLEYAIKETVDAQGKQDNMQ
jgi:hypothetical protein